MKISITIAYVTALLRQYMLMHCSEIRVVKASPRSIYLSGTISPVNVQVDLKINIHSNIHSFKHLFKKQTLWTSPMLDAALKTQAVTVKEKGPITGTYGAYHDLLRLGTNWCWETGEFSLLICATEACFPLHLKFLQNLLARYYVMWGREGGASLSTL